MNLTKVSDLKSFQNILSESFLHHHSLKKLCQLSRPITLLAFLDSSVSSVCWSQRHVIRLFSSFPSSNPIEHNLWFVTNLEVYLFQHRKCNTQLVLQMQLFLRLKCCQHVHSFLSSQMIIMDLLFNARVVTQTSQFQVMQISPYSKFATSFTEKKKKKRIEQGTNSSVLNKNVIFKITYLNQSGELHKTHTYFSMNSAYFRLRLFP